MTWNPRLLVINVIVGCMMRLHHGHGLEESHTFWIAQLDSPAVCMPSYNKKEFENFIFQ